MISRKTTFPNWFAEYPAKCRNLDTSNLRYVESSTFDDLPTILFSTLLLEANVLNLLAAYYWM